MFIPWDTRDSHGISRGTWDPMGNGSWYPHLKFKIFPSIAVEALLLLDEEILVLLRRLICGARAS